MNKILQKNFDELKNEADKIEDSRILESDDIDQHLLLSWKIRVKNLLSKISDENSQYIQELKEAEENFDPRSHFDMFNNLKAVFLAAKKDFEGGYLISIKTLIQADVFDSELEQARELLNKDYIVAAAVIAGVVLETTLRELCDRENIPHGKLDKMNADLTKADVYNKLEQKKITAWADIRNNAAHGKPDEFIKQDVINMIEGVNEFLLKHL